MFLGGRTQFAPTYEFTKYRTEKLNIPENNDIIIKRMIGIIHPCEKGMGSAYGGRWIPKKPEDERLLGKPGEVKRSFKDGYWVDVKIGEDGKAVRERHYTDHNRAWDHTNPHDHIIKWDPKTGAPIFVKNHINYYGDAPEFKKYKGDNAILNNTYIYSNNFTSIADFKDCMNRGGEVQFEWAGKRYSIGHDDEYIRVGEGCYNKNGKYYNVLSNTEYDIHDEFCAKTADELLEFEVGGDRLRDVITKVKVIERTW